MPHLSTTRAATNILGQPLIVLNFMYLYKKALAVASIGYMVLLCDAQGMLGDVC